MNLRKKAALIIILLCFFSFFAVFAASHSVIMSGFLDLEKQDIRTQVDRADNAFEAEVVNLDIFVNDYATWDDTYQFIQDNNTAYIQSNLMDETFLHSFLSLMIYMDSSGQVVFSKAGPMLRSTEPSVLSSVASYFSENSDLWNFSEGSSYKRGVACISDKVFLFSSRPILTSEAQGPVRGALIMGRELTPEMVSSLEEKTNLQIAFVRLSDNGIPPDFQEAKTNLGGIGSLYIKPLNNSEAAGYTILGDLLNNPSLLMGVNVQRSIYNQGLTVINSYTIMIIGWFAVFGLVTILLFERAFLSRLGTLTRSVVNITRKGDMNQRVPMNYRKYWRNDEVSSLSESVNSMLDKLQEMTGELTKAQRFAAVGELSVMIAHDLRNPLQGIMIAADYLKFESAGTPEKRAKMLDLIKSDVAYCEKIVNDLLGYSKEIRVEPRETSFSRLLSNALEHVQVPKNVRVNDLTQSEPKISLDIEKMLRVFENLIKNAIDAMPNGGSITVKSEVSDKVMWISFADTGTGIAKENLDKLFSPLFTTKAKGMGFGLAICKRIVEAHKGKISVESVLGEGTTFMLEIPIQK